MADMESKIEAGAAKAPAFAEFDTRVPPVMLNLNPDPLRNFNPVQVIYRLLVPVPPMGLRYAFIDAPTPIDADPAAIRNFVAEAARGNYRRTTPMGEETHPLGITVDRDSYIVLHLDDAYPTWDFTNVYEAVTLDTLVDGPEPSLLYGNLKYVRPSGAIFNDAQEGCRLVYFEARFRAGTEADPYLQKFNVGVDSGNPATVHWIDPDVRHPGGGG